MEPDSPHQRDSGHVDFEQIHDFRPRIARYLGRLVGPDQAEDLTQEVFAKAVRALPRFRGECKVSTWLYRIATHTAFDALRSPSLRRARDVRIEDRMPDPAPDAEQELARDEMNACIRGYVDGLPAIYRSVVLLSDQEGLADREIADALGVSLQTVKIRLHRARARLRTALADGCTLYRDERNELACEPRPELYPLAPPLRPIG